MNERLGKILGLVKGKFSGQGAQPPDAAGGQSAGFTPPPAQARYIPAAARAAAAESVKPAPAPAAKTPAPVPGKAPAAQVPVPVLAKAPAPARFPAAGGAPESTQFFQQRIADLEKRLYEAQQKIKGLPPEPENKVETPRPAPPPPQEEFSRPAPPPKPPEPDRRFEERIARLEALSQAPAAAPDPSALFLERLFALEGRLAAAEAGLNEASVKSGLRDKLTARDNTAARERAERLEKNAVPPDYLEGRLSQLAESLGAAELRISRAEAGLNEAAAKVNLRDKITAQDSAQVRERVENLEKSIAPPDYWARKVLEFERDSFAIRKVEGAVAGIREKIEKLEAEYLALLQEQAEAAELSKADGVAIEELRAKMANISAIFNHLRRSTVESLK